jgi:hypothetical protein
MVFITAVLTVNFRRVPSISMPCHGVYLALQTDTSIR